MSFCFFFFIFHFLSQFWNILPVGIVYQWLELWKLDLNKNSHGFELFNIKKMILHIWSGHRSKTPLPLFFKYFIWDSVKYIRVKIKIPFSKKKKRLRYQMLELLKDISYLIISEFFERCCNSHTKTKHIHGFDLLTVSQTKSNCGLPHHK